MSPVVASRRLTPARVLSFLFANLVWLAPLFLAPATNASAATDTYTVGSTADDSGVVLATAQTNCPVSTAGTNTTGDGSCTLRDAIMAANADTTATALVVDMTTIGGTITVGSNLPQMSVATGTTFEGPGAGALTVSGANLYQLFVFLSGSGGGTFQYFTIANGFVSATGGCTCDPGYGAGVYGYTGVPLILTDMVFSGNSAANGGGAVVAIGVLTVTGTTFSNNTSPAAGGGIAGALYVIGSPATIYQSTFSGNTAWIGSAVYTYTPVTLTISDSTFANNSNGTEGVVGGSGAVFNDNLSTLTIHDSTFWNNVGAAGVGGALNNAGTMTVTDSIVGSPGDSGNADECYSNNTVNGPGCPANGDANGNITAPATFNLAPLGFYGGANETLLPMSGSAAICGGKTGAGLDADATGAALTVDERGFPLDPSCGAGTTDAGAVQLNPLVVNSATDDGPGAGASTCTTDCTLRDAINVANNAGNGDITFDSSLNGSTITLGDSTATPGTALTITGGVNIAGPGATLLTLSGQNKYEPFYVAAGSLSVSGLTITNGSATTGTNAGFGGAILNGGSLSVSNVTFTNNTCLLYTSRCV